MKLSILIPTYNRSKYLLKNISLLSEYIRKGNFQNEIEIVISDNHSNDSTGEIVGNFEKSNPDISIRYFLQEENIGLEKNALFVLKNAFGDFVMFIGDDDYIEFMFLEEVVNCIGREEKLTAIICNPIGIDENGRILNHSRDSLYENRKFEKGFKSCWLNSWRAHQLSGLTLKRENLYELYLQNKVYNIYPFIYFLSISCLQGKVIHLTKYPVKVTSPTQDKKDWNYGKDGLLNDIYDNYKKLPINSFKRTWLQLYFFHRQNWRLFKYHSLGRKKFVKTVGKIWLANNGLIWYKIIFPIFFIYEYYTLWKNKKLYP